jgi:hypothetical protein
VWRRSSNEQQTKQLPLNVVVVSEVDQNEHSFLRIFNQIKIKHMTVKQLIERLQQVKNQDSDVYIKNTDPTDYTVLLKMKPKDIKENQKLLGDNIFDEGRIELFDEETDKYIGPKVVTITLDY